MASVLFVDEDDLSRSEYISGLQAAGHSVVAANSAQATLDALDTVKPDVLVLDIALAVHNGITVLYEMMSYSDWSTIPVVILSMIPQSEFISDDALWRQLHVEHYCYKPTTRPADLALIVNEVTA